MYFDIEAHKECFKTKKDEAYFWHGQTNGCGGQNNAIAIADELSNNGMTLEMCMLEHREELEKAGVRFRDNDDRTVSIDYGNSRDESRQFWDDCSKAFAEQSSGNVHVIAGTDPRPNGQSENDYPSVYNRIEHPALEQNQQVNSIIHIDPYNRTQTGCETFDRSNKSRDIDLKADLGIDNFSQAQSSHDSHIPQSSSSGPKELSEISHNADEISQKLADKASSAERTQNAANTMTGGLV